MISSFVSAADIDFEIEGAVPNTSGSAEPVDEGIHDVVGEPSELAEDAGHGEVHHKKIPLKYYVSFISVLVIILLWFSIRMMLRSY